MDQPKLDQDAIVSEAIRLLNDEGLDSISVRKLADRLGIKAPSLYWHIRDKNALLAAVNERIITQCLEDLPKLRNWRDWMRAFGLALWKAQETVRDFGRLVTTTNISPEQLRRTTDSIRGKLQGLNLPEAEALELQSTIQAMVTGWSAFAHAPYAGELSKSLDFDKLMVRSLDATIVGYASLMRSNARKATHKRRRK